MVTRALRMTPGRVGSRCQSQIGLCAYEASEEDRVSFYTIGSVRGVHIVVWSEWRRIATRRPGKTGTAGTSALQGVAPDGTHTHTHTHQDVAGRIGAAAHLRGSGLAHGGTLTARGTSSPSDGRDRLEKGGGEASHRTKRSAGVGRRPARPRRALSGRIAGLATTRPAAPEDSARPVWDGQQSVRERTSP
jgi:hypothetical protein